MSLTPEVKKEIIAKYGSSATDTGSPEAQVALLSRRIEDITTHLKTNPHDHHNRRGLLLLVGQRRELRSKIHLFRLACSYRSKVQSTCLGI